MKKIFNKNSAAGERISKLELVVERLAMKSSTIQAALISPYPISAAVFGDEVKGTILTYMFPCDGTIVKGAIDIGKKPKNPITINYGLLGSIYNRSDSFTTDKRQLVVEPNVDVKGFDRLMVGIDYDGNLEKITECWISFLWLPSSKNVKAISYSVEDLTDALLQLQEE